jgi:internalin A
MKGASLLAVLVIGGFSVDFAQQEEGERAKAIRAIEEKGGGVGYDEDAPGRPVTSVGLINSKEVRDEDLINLRSFRMLKSLHLIGINITSGGLLKLDGFDHLTGLDLMDTNVDDDALKWVAKNKELSILCLSNSISITDKALVYISGLKKLKELSLDGTKVTDAGLAYLKEMKTLRRLHLGETKVTDEGVNSLKKALPNLIITR